jgi:PhnB protein
VKPEVLDPFKFRTTTGEVNMPNVKPIPDGYHSITPYLIIRGAKKAMEFYKQAFGAQEVFKMEDDKGEIGHAEMRIGNSIFMLANEKADFPHKSPATLGGSPISILLYVEDVDSVFKQAVSAGAEVERPVANQFYGDRTGGVKDPFGFSWYIATHVEDVSPEEMERRAKSATPA